MWVKGLGAETGFDMSWLVKMKMWIAMSMFVFVLICMPSW